MKILIVDDMEENREVLGAMLRSEGFADLCYADSAASAFRLLGLHEDGTASAEGGGVGGDVDLILMDIAMPEIDGIEACRRIRAVERLRDIPVIMVTALTEKALLAVAFDAGASDYITKPVDKVELLARLRSALRLKEEIESHRVHYRELLDVKRRLKETEEELRRLTEGE